MSQLPPCSGRPGTVRAPSRPIFSARPASDVVLTPPGWQLCGSGGSATSRPSSLELAMSWPSRSFHVARTSGEGAQPRMPGWMSPANLTCGMCRDVQ